MMKKIGYLDMAPGHFLPSQIPSTEQKCLRDSLSFPRYLETKNTYAETKITFVLYIYPVDPHPDGLIKVFNRQTAIFISKWSEGKTKRSQNINKQ